MGLKMAKHLKVARRFISLSVRLANARLNTIEDALLEVTYLGLQICATHTTYRGSHGVHHNWNCVKCLSSVNVQIISKSTSTIGDRGGTMVKVLCYKSEGRWFDPR